MKVFLLQKMQGYKILGVMDVSPTSLSTEDPYKEKGSSGNHHSFMKDHSDRFNDQGKTSWWFEGKLINPFVYLDKGIRTYANQTFK